mmetsp:Transcript_98756/g.284986  ORF Transcript_98756/g.284986 Transcript_98756/m.284986 type:complete len:206 (-) Transcript_98756:136-753(-)
MRPAPRDYRRDAAWSRGARVGARGKCGQRLRPVLRRVLPGRRGGVSPRGPVAAGDQRHLGIACRLAHLRARQALDCGAGAAPPQLLQVSTWLGSVGHARRQRAQGAPAGIGGRGGSGIVDVGLAAGRCGALSERRRQPFAAVPRGASRGGSGCQVSTRRVGRRRSGPARAGQRGDSGRRRCELAPGRRRSGGRVPSGAGSRCGRR